MRDKDRKRDESSDRLDDYTQKIENRFDKQARATLVLGSKKIQGHRVDNQHKDDGGKHRF